jgi:hypothetical protein
MRLHFRQGIVSHQTTSGQQDFLTVNPSGNIDLLANNRPTTLTIAHGNSNYTFIEDFTVSDAWVGPFTNGENYWLYWDFNLLTFERTFGYTQLEPVVQSTEPGSGNTEIIGVIPSTGSPANKGAFIVHGYFQHISGFNFAVINSDDNDGNYTVYETTFNGTLNQTTFYVNENVNAFIGPEYGETTFDIDYYGQPLRQVGRHWFDTITNKHYVWQGTAWSEVIRVFAAHFIAPNQFYSESILGTGFTGTQIGNTSSILSGRVLFDESSNPIRRDNRTFFTTEDQFFANASNVNAIRLESNVVRAQLLDPAASAFSIVAWTSDGKITTATYNDIGTTVVGILSESLLINEVGAVIIQGVVSNPNWNWTEGPSAVPVGNPLWVENGQLVTYDPHTFKNRTTSDVVNVQNGDTGQFFEVVGAYTLENGAMISIVDSTENNNGSYTVLYSEYVSAGSTTRVYVDEIIIDPDISGQMLLTVGNFPYPRVPIARVLDKDTIIFEQGLGGVGDRGPAGSIENLPLATTSQNGSIYINIDPLIPEIPIAVGDNDPRLSDARTPLYHTHTLGDFSITPYTSPIPGHGGITSTNIQDGLEEIYDKKANLQPNYATAGVLPNAITYEGMLTYLVDEGAHYMAESGTWNKIATYPITITPYASPIPGLGNISSSNIQNAFEEVFDKKASLLPTYATFANLPSAITYEGMVAYVVDEASHYLAQGGTWNIMATYPLTIPYDLAYYFAGLMLLADVPAGAVLATRTLKLPANLPGAIARAKNAPLTDVTYAMRVDNGTVETPVGSLTFTAGNRVGTFTFVSEIIMSAGDSLEFVTPSTLEPNISDVAITIPACAVATYCGPMTP